MIARIANSITGIFSRGLFGPVFQREVRVAGRRSSTYWVRGLYVLGLTVLASLVYFAITAETRFASSGNAEALQELQMFAPTLAAFFVWFQFVAMSFVASTLTAGAICDERRKGSLSALLTTPLSLLQIMLGKMSGRLIQLVILLASGVPLLLAARIFGGISTQFIVASIVLTLCVALLHASIALAASTSRRNSAAASGSGLVGGVLWCLLPMIVSLVFAYVRSQSATMLSLSISPYFTLGMETASSFGIQGGPSGMLAWYYAAAYAFGGALLFLAIALHRFKLLARTGGDPLPGPTSKKQNKKTKTAKAGTSTDAHATGDASSLAIAPPDPLTVGDSPILWREMRQRIFLKAWHPRVALLGVVLLLLYIYSQAGWGEPAVIIVSTALLFALFYFQSSVIASNSVAGERESRSLEVLLTTPVSARDIVWAKWAGSLRRLLPIPIFYFPFVLVCGVFSGKFSWVLIPHLFFVAIPPVLFLVATGVWFSVLTRRATVAATLNIILAMAVWIALPLIAIAIATMLQPFTGADITREVMSPFLIVNPAAMTITALTGATVDLWGSARSTRYESFIPFNFVTYSLAVAGFAAAYMGLAWAALRLAARSLGHRTNREV